MSNLSDNYTKWIKSFNPTQFNTIVSTYIRKRWGLDDFTSCDGTGDGGNDLKFFLNKHRLKIQVQITVQEANIGEKIAEDVEKAYDNFKKHAYEPRLYFFYSQPISEGKVKDYEDEAMKKHGVELVIIDAKKIAQEADSDNDIRNVVRDQFGLPRESGASFTTEADKAVYDLITFGDSSIEIKTQVLKSFLSHYLNGNPEKKLHEIQAAFKNKFGNSIDDTYCTRLIGKLLTDKVLLKDKAKDTYSLSPSESERVNRVKEEFNFQEQKLSNDLKELLKTYGLEDDYSQIIKLLQNLFEESFDIDYLEIMDKGDQIENDGANRPFIQLFNSIRAKLGDKERTKILVREIFAVCTSNDILQKLSAGKIYSKFINNKLLDNYISQQGRTVYLDAQILLYAICIYYEETDYPNPFYQAVHDLLNRIRANSKYKLAATSRYVKEVSYHFKEALLLIPYDKLGFLNELGGSSNVFYNYYTYLKKEELLDDNVEDFTGFLIELGFDEDIMFQANFFNMAESILDNILNNLGIEIVDLKDYDYSSAKGIFISLMAQGKFKYEHSLNNDSCMLTALFDKELHQIEPIFCTWDSAFFAARKKYAEKDAGSRLWHLFTPDRLINHLSLLNFTISSESLSRDILSSIDENFNIHKKSQKLIDSIIKLLDIKSETGRAYVNKMKNFKREYVYSVNIESRDEYDSMKKIELPIEKLLMELTKHYTFASGKYNLEDFKKIFTAESGVSSVTDYFVKELEYMVSNNANSPDYISKMDTLIEQAR